MSTWDTPKDTATVEKTVANLIKNGIDAKSFSDRETLKTEVLSLIPKGAEVMNMTSVTLDTLGLTEVLQHSGTYHAVKNDLAKMDRQTQDLEMRKLGSAPAYAVGSVHAVTEEGTVLAASNTGSQLAAYVYGAEHVIWVVGTQKIVANTDEGMKRIYEYSLKMEDERAQKAYGIHSNVSKILIISKEVKPQRIHLFFLNENIGF